MAENSIGSQKQIQSPVQEPIPQTLTSNSTNSGIVTSSTQTAMQANSPSLDIPQQKLLKQQQQQHNLVMQRSPSMSSFNQVQMDGGQGQFGIGGGGQQQGDGGGSGSGVMLGQSNFGESVISQQQQLQLWQQFQQQQQQQMNVGGSGNMGRGGLMGQNGQMLQGHLNMQSPMLVSPRQKAGLVQGAQYQAGNISDQMLQEMQSGGMSGSLNMAQQIRDNGSLNYTQQRTSQGQMRQQMLLQSPLISQMQDQNLIRSSSLAFMNSQMSGLVQNGQPTIMQNSSTKQQQQWLKQMPGMNTPALPSYRLHQQRLLMQQQMASSGQMNQNPLALNQQQLHRLVQNESATPRQQLQQQLAQQVVANQQRRQQYPRIVGPYGQKTFSLTGSQPDASGATTPGRSSSQGTEATNQLLGKRKIQDLVSQVDLHAKLDPEVEDILLEHGDSFIESATTFAITLAKHRNSSTLDAKDLLLHLEKNWNLKIPGYSSEEQQNPSKPAPNEIHKKRLDAIRMLMESSQPKGNTNITKDAQTTTPPMQGMDGQHNLNHHLMQPFPSSKFLVAKSASGAQMMHQHQHQHQLTHF